MHIRGQEEANVDQLKTTKIETTKTQSTQVRKRPEEAESLQNTPKDEEGWAGVSKLTEKNRCIYSIKKTSTNHTYSKKNKKRKTHQAQPSFMPLGLLVKGYRITHVIFMCKAPGLC